MKKIVLFLVAIGIAVSGFAQIKQFIVEGNQSNNIEFIKPQQINSKNKLKSADSTQDLSKTLNVVDAGKLASLLTANELQSVTHLTLSGSLNYLDFETMRDEMPVLRYVNILNVTVKGRTDNTYGIFGNYYPYEDNIIPPEAFHNKATLITVILPSNLISNGLGAFAFCSSLSSVTLPDGLAMITNNSFYGCDNLFSINIPSSVYAVYGGAFYKCGKINTIDLSKNLGLYVIGDNAFQDCISLDNIKLPENLQTIGQASFLGCTKLKNIDLPQNLYSIKGAAFRESGLEKISIPSHVSYIGDDNLMIAGAFADCPNLTEVNVGWIIPLKINWQQFNGTNTANATLKVPLQSAQFYRNSLNWKDFGTIEDEMVLVEGDTFSMGYPSVYGNLTSISMDAYFISKYEVTQSTWYSVMGYHSLFSEGGNYPAHDISWLEAVSFCNTLSGIYGYSDYYNIDGKNVTMNPASNGFRLPTEAEWEFAARGGKQTQNYTYSGSNNIDEVAWYGKNYADGTMPVGTKQPNELGLYDMSGNVIEWVWDWYAYNYINNTYLDGQNHHNPTGPETGGSLELKMCRGGSYWDNAYRNEILNRDYCSSVNDGDGENGFRIVRNYSNDVSITKSISCQTVRTSFGIGGLQLVNWEAKGFVPELDKIVVQLSDNNGSFDNATDVTSKIPMILGEQTESGYKGISCFIPSPHSSDPFSPQPIGTKFRIRVLCLDPSIAGTDNGVDITIENSVDQGIMNYLGIEEGEQWITHIEAGKTYKVNYGMSIPYDLIIGGENYFEIQLSDNSGKFSNPTTLGSLKTQNNEGDIVITIPRNMPTGDKYRIRVVSTNPKMIGSDNDEDLTITNNSNPSNFSCSIGTTSLKPNEKYILTVNKSQITINDNFIVYLSDEKGSFDKQVIIGSAPGVANKSSQSVEITIPANIKSGTKYRIRVYSQGEYSSDNGQDLTIGTSEDLKEYKLTDNLTIYYNTLEQLSTTKFKASGNVNINKILHFDCPIEIERINKDQAFIRGTGGLFVLEIKGESFKLKDGEFKYRAEENKLELIYTKLTSVETMLKIIGMNASLGDMELDKANDWIRIAYSFYDPGFPFKQIVEHDYAEYKKWARSDDMLLIDKAEYLSPKLKGAAYYSKTKGVSYSFDVSINTPIDLKFFKLKKMTVKFDQIKEEYSGNIAFSINVKKSLTTDFSSFAGAPLEIVSDDGEVLQETTLENYLRVASAGTENTDLSLELELEYKKGKFKLKAAASGLEIPIPSTPVMITKISANYEYEDKKTVDYFGFGATVDIAPVGKDFTKGLTSAIIEGKDIGFQVGNPPFTLSISGKLNLFKSEVANAKIAWDGGKSTFSMSGGLDLLDIVAGDLNLNINSDGCNGTVYGYVHVPKSLTKYDFLSSLTDWKFNGTTINWYNRSFDFEIQAFWDKISCAGVYTGVVGWGEFPYWDFYWGKNLKDLGIAQKSSSNMRSASSNITFYLTESNTPKLYTMFWGENALIDFSMVSPSGKTYNKSNALYQELNNKLQTVMAVEKPEAGEWTIIPNGNYENFKVYSLDMTPTLMFDKPVTKETNTNIRLLLNDFADDLTVTFFYDTDKSGFDGLPITELTGVHDAVLDYTWHPQDLPTGDYYIYCRVDDGKNTPILLYAPGAISISNSPSFTLSPKNLKQEKKDNNILVSWEASTDERINYATVYYKNDKTGNILGRVSDSSSVTLDDLVPGIRYQVWACYTDTLDVESDISNIVEFTYSKNGNNPPYFIRNEDYWVFREGQSGKMEFDVYDADGNNLSFSVLENISNYQLSGNSFKWKPTTADLSLSMLNIVVSDGLAKDTLQQKIRFIDKEKQGISVSFAAPVLYDANYHFVKIENPLPMRSKFENILIQNKRTGYKIVLPCDKVADDLFMGKLVLTKDQNSFIPVQTGDTIQLHYQYGGFDYTDYAVYNSVETRAFRLTPGDIASLNGQQYAAIPENTEKADNQQLVVYPNPSTGEFNLCVDGIKDVSNYSLSIFDLQGKLIYNSLDIASGSNLNKKIRISHINPGNYLINVVVFDKKGNKIYSGSRQIVIR